MAPANDPLGKRALFWAPADRTEPGLPDPDAPAPGRRALFSTPAPQPGALTLDCASCHARSHVNYLEFARLHLPFWLWIPGRRFSRLLTCPACERRAWVRVSWRP
jgi:hypothetical protein